MKIVLLGCLIICCFSFLAQAQTIPVSPEAASLRQLQRAVAEQAIQDFAREHPGQPIPGELLAALMPQQDEECDETAKQKREQTEIVAIFSVNSARAGERKEKSLQEGLWENEQRRLAQVPWSEQSQGLTPEALKQRAHELWDAQKYRSQLDLTTPLGQAVLVEALVQGIPSFSGSEQELTSAVANVVGQSFSSRAARVEFLSQLSRRLNENYALERNPGHNLDRESPARQEISRRDMSFQEIFTSAARFNPYGGGVCNDIAEMIVQLAQSTYLDPITKEPMALFPGEDALLLAHGSHVVPLISNGKNHTIINGEQMIDSSGQMSISPQLAATSMRLMRVVPGPDGSFVARQVAQVDTQTGQLVSMVTENERPLIMTGPELSQVAVAHLRSIQEREDGRRREYTLSAGLAGIAGSSEEERSQVIIVYARRSSEGAAFKRTIGAGASVQSWQDGQASYQVHINAALTVNAIHYLHPSGQLNTPLGKFTHNLEAQFAAQFTPNNPTDKAWVDYSARGSLINRAALSNRAFTASGSTEHVVGPRSMGDLVGSSSVLYGKGMVRSMDFFMLNQVNAQVTTTQVKGIQGQVTYQGSQIGQTIDYTTMINVQANNGAQITLLAGHTQGRSGLGDFGTQNNLLATPLGPHAGVRYQTQRGLELQIRAREVGTSKSSLEMKGSVPLRNPASK
jgi:hypothetical protein